MNEEILLVDRLLLRANTFEVSQPFAIGSANQIEIHAWIESAETLASPYAVVQLQVSPDMDNFADKYGFTVTLTAAPPMAPAPPAEPMTNWPALSSA